MIETPRWGRARPPVGLIGMIAIVIAVESWIGRRPVEVTETSSYSWTLSEAAARREAKGARVLCLGDSLVKHGLLPEVIEARLGETTYNLAICAAPAPAQYYLLRHALDAGATPRAIVIDFMPGLLFATPKYARRYWPELLRPGDVIDLAVTSRSVSFLTTTAIEMLFPSARSRWELRGRIVAAVRGEADKLTATNLTHERNWSVHRGAQFSPDNPGFTGAVTPEQHVEFLSARFWCHRLNRTYIDRILTLAESRAIRVYWLLPPASPEIQARRDESGSDAQHTRFVREVSAKYPNVVVLDARRARFPHDRFVDPVHLTGRGALALSASVADAMARNRSGWVDCVESPEPSAPTPMEDVEQSRLAVLTQLGRRSR